MKKNQITKIASENCNLRKNQEKNLQEVANNLRISWHNKIMWLIEADLSGLASSTNHQRQKTNHLKVCICNTQRLFHAESDQNV